MAAQRGEAKEKPSWGAEIVADIAEPLVAAHGEARWALQRTLYGLDSAVSSPAWQTFFLLLLAFAITLSAGRIMEATENSMHTNEAHDTSYSVRAQGTRMRPVKAPAGRRLQLSPKSAERLRWPSAAHLTPAPTPQEGIWLAWILFVDPASIPYA